MVNAKMTKQNLLLLRKSSYSSKKKKTVSHKYRCLVRRFAGQALTPRCPTRAPYTLVYVSFHRDVHKSLGLHDVNPKLLAGANWISRRPEK